MSETLPINANVAKDEGSDGIDSSQTPLRLAPQHDQDYFDWLSLDQQVDDSYAEFESNQDWAIFEESQPSRKTLLMDAQAEIDEFRADEARKAPDIDYFAQHNAHQQDRLQRFERSRRGAISRYEVVADDTPTPQISEKLDWLGESVESYTRTLQTEGKKTTIEKIARLVDEINRLNPTDDDDGLLTRTVTWLRDNRRALSDDDIIGAVQFIHNRSTALADRTSHAEVEASKLARILRRPDVVKHPRREHSAAHIPDADKRELQWREAALDIHLKTTLAAQIRASEEDLQYALEDLEICETTASSKIAELLEKIESAQSVLANIDRHTEEQDTTNERLRENMKALIDIAREELQDEEESLEEDREEVAELRDTLTRFQSMSETAYDKLIAANIVKLRIKKGEERDERLAEQASLSSLGHEERARKLVDHLNMLWGQRNDGSGGGRSVAVSHTKGEMPSINQRQHTEASQKLAEIKQRRPKAPKRSLVKGQWVVVPPAEKENSSTQTKPTPTHNQRHGADIAASKLPATTASRHDTKPPKTSISPISESARRPYPTGILHTTGFMR